MAKKTIKEAVVEVEKELPIETVEKELANSDEPKVEVIVSEPEVEVEETEPTVEIKTPIKEEVLPKVTEPIKVENPPVGQQAMTRGKNDERKGVKSRKDRNPADNGWLITYKDGTVEWSKREESKK